MHAPLGVPERQAACFELINALEKCHAKSAWFKFLGGCNDEKDALNMCLRKERLDRTARNREKSKERNRKKEEAWAALEKDVSGDA